jgi:hypothetical protein
MRKTGSLKLSKDTLRQLLEQDLDKIEGNSPVPISLVQATCPRLCGTRNCTRPC